MDTSGLESSLSLAGFLLVFAYLSLVGHAILADSRATRPSEQEERLNLLLRTFRLASVVAAALSLMALVASQSSPSVGLIAIAALALIVMLIILDRATRGLVLRYATTASTLALPIRASLTPMCKLSKSFWPMTGQPVTANGSDHSGTNGQTADVAGPVITQEEEEALDARERLMIRSILRLDEATVREIMVPRVDIIAVESNATIAEVTSRMLEWGHSRIPVYTETVDDIIGVAYARDLLPFLINREEYPALKEIIRPAYFIPESKRLDDLLKELQEKHLQMALVVDEYGGIEGVVTLEDLLEEIVGEIEDEFSRSLGPRVVPMANGDLIVDARVTLDYLSDLYSTTIQKDEVATVGGLVYSSLGKMPQVGDEVLNNGLNIKVESLLGRRIGKLRLSKSAN